MSSVVHVITGLDGGGAETVLYQLCTHDTANRHYVISLTGGGKYGPLLADAAIPVTCLGMPRGRVTLGGLRQMWRIIRERRPDVVQTWMTHSNLLGGIVARLAGRRNICWGIHQGQPDPERTSRKTILVDRMSARLSRWIPRRIVCCAERARELNAMVGYDRKRMHVIRNGYDLASFRPDPTAGTTLRRALGLKSSEPIIGFVARFHPVKDHATLFAALAILREAAVRPVCVLVGAGMDQENAELTRMIDKLGLTDQVRLLGPRGDIPAVMNALDLHVMSSASEAFPNVLAEAMACGTPCVSTAVGDAAQILGATGRLVPPHDPAALADGIAQMLTERNGPDWFGRREAARRHIVENFSMERMLENYRRIWSLDGDPGEDPDRPTKVHASLPANAS